MGGRLAGIGWFVCTVSALVACGGDSVPPTSGVDAGLTDAGNVDAGHLDAGNVDAGNVDAAACVDEDGDGHGASPCGDDCDDADATRYPGATEVCDLDDEDCNDTTYGVDADSDGFESVACCNGVDRCGPDCDDAINTVNPGASESCNGLDDDCDGVADDGVGLLPDCDRDGFGNPTGTRSATCSPTAAPACAGSAGVWVAASGDCDDTSPSTSPASPERCDGRDNDCNGVIDDEPATDAACAADALTRGAPAGVTAVCAAGRCALRCSPDAGPCIDCLDATDCATSLAGRICDLVNRRCVECNGSADCTDPIRWHCGPSLSCDTGA